MQPEKWICKVHQRYLMIQVVENMQTHHSVTIWAHLRNLMEHFLDSFRLNRYKQRDEK